jgi:hypothetical protein
LFSGRQRVPLRERLRKENSTFVPASSAREVEVLRARRAGKRNVARMSRYSVVTIRLTVERG